MNEPHWTSRVNSLQLIELSSIYKVYIKFRFPTVATLANKGNFLSEFLGEQFRSDKAITS